MQGQIVTEIKLKKYYEIATRRLNPVAYKAMATMEDDNDPSATILRIISQTRKDGPVPLQELLIQIYEDWEAIVIKKGITSACPISFTQDEISVARNSAEAWAAAYYEFESLRSDLLGKDGWVSHEGYDLAKTRFGVLDVTIFSERMPELQRETRPFQQCCQKRLAYLQPGQFQHQAFAQLQLAQLIYCFTRQQQNCACQPY
jgi:hypothetical protein